MAKLVKLCFIRRSFFEIHSDYTKILDVGLPQKQSQRTHLCVVIEKDDNHFFIPLRNNLGDAVRKYGRIGHSVPSETRKRAGLDYRYALIVNDWEYVEDATERRIPKRQLKQIENDYDEICREFTVYLNGYKKAAKKGKVDKIPLFRESSLVNFHSELNI